MKTVTSNYATILHVLVTFILVRHGFDNVSSLIKLDNNYQIKPKVYGLRSKHLVNQQILPKQLLPPVMNDFL